MVLTWVNPTDDIIVQEGNFAYNYKASGTIYEGQVVHINDTMRVTSTASNDKNIVGVAAYTVTNNEYVAVYGPGNIVRCKSSGAINVGSRVCGGYGGHVCSAPAAQPAEYTIGIALETVATDKNVRVLLV